MDTLVDSLKQLKQLRELTLLLHEILRDEHLISIFTSLLLLEEIYVSGLELNDVMLQSLAGIRNLRSVTLSGISKFTTDGLLEYISQLGPGNMGIRVHIDMADPETVWGESDQILVKDCLAQKTGGSLEYTAYRGRRKFSYSGVMLTTPDPYNSDFEGESD